MREVLPVDFILLSLALSSRRGGDSAVVDELFRITNFAEVIESWHQSAVLCDDPE